MPPLSYEELIQTSPLLTERYGGVDIIISPLLSDAVVRFYRGDTYEYVDLPEWKMHCTGSLKEQADLIFGLLDKLFGITDEPTDELDSAGRCQHCQTLSSPEDTHCKSCGAPR